MVMATGDRDWDRHLQDIFHSARQATEQLREENATLRGHLAFLQQRQEANPDAEQRILALEQSLLALTHERDTLRMELTAMQEVIEESRRENRQFAEQFVTIERQNSNFISLYVASSQLHATLDHQQVLLNIKEIVINLIGADRFGVYLFEAATGEFRLATGEEMTPEEHAPIPYAGTIFGQAAATGQLYLAPPEHAPLDGSQPIAIQPLMISGELVGLLVIYRLLTQKDGFEPVDLEVFALGAAHAAAALMSSQLYLRSERKAATLRGLLGLFQAEAGAEPGV
jgi:hypothetical protein